MKKKKKSNLENIKECFKEYHTTLSFLKITIMGIKREEKTYMALGVKINFPLEATQKSEVIFKTPKVIVYQEIRSINNEDLNQLLEQIRQQRMVLGDYSFNLENFNKFDFNRFKSGFKKPLYLKYYYPEYSFKKCIKLGGLSVKDNKIVIKDEAGGCEEAPMYKFLDEYDFEDEE